MATDPAPPPNNNLSSAERSSAPVFHDAAEEAASRAVLGGAHTDHTLANHIAAVTETPEEAAIDAANGLRGHGGRTPQPEDFADILPPEGNSGDIVGSDVGTGSPFVFGEDGSLGDTDPK